MSHSSKPSSGFPFSLLVKPKFLKWSNGLLPLFLNPGCIRNSQPPPPRIGGLGGQPSFQADCYVQSRGKTSRGHCPCSLCSLNLPLTSFAPATPVLKLTLVSQTCQGHPTIDPLPGTFSPQICQAYSFASSSCLFICYLLSEALS